MKTALVSTTGRLVGYSVQEVELFHPEPGAAEQDPAEWWDALINTTKNLLAKKLVDPKDIVACITANQMDGTIPIDKDGKVLHRCILWMDTRGAPMIKKALKGKIEISGWGISNLLKWIPKTGGAPGLTGKDIIAHILYLKEKKPEIYKATYKFLDCKDYLTYKLTGKIVTSYDCGFLSWCVDTRNMNKIRYDKKLARKLKINLDQLPELKPSTEIVGNILPELARELGLSEDMKVVLGCGDLAAAAIGSGAVLDLQPHICVGSSSWLVCHNTERKLDVVNMIASIPSGIPGKYIALGEQEAAGINLTWLRDKVLYHKDELLVTEDVPDIYKIFDKIVPEVPPGSKNVIFTPWLFGERSPIEDHTVRGGLFNVSLDIDRRHIIRAIFEGVAYNMKWLLDAMEGMLKTRLEPINIIGGGATSNIWCQIFADVLDRKIKQVNAAKEANAVGVALIASIALGYMKWEDVPNVMSFKAEYTPNPANREVYDKLFEEFKLIYKNNKDMYRRLNAH
jgi:xylulokinase